MLNICLFASFKLLWEPFENLPFFSCQNQGKILNQHISMSKIDINFKISIPQKEILFVHNYVNIVAIWIFEVYAIYVQNIVWIFCTQKNTLQFFFSRSTAFMDLIETIYDFVICCRGTRGLSININLVGLFSYLHTQINAWKSGLFQLSVLGDM